MLMITNKENLKDNKFRNCKNYEIDCWQDGEGGAKFAEEALKGWLTATRRRGVGRLYRNKIHFTIIKALKCIIL